MGVGTFFRMFLDVTICSVLLCTVLYGVPAGTKVLYCLYPVSRERKEGLEGEKNVHT